MSYLDDLVTVQNDAFDNLYDIEITFPAQIGTPLSAIHMRLRAEDVTIPAPKVEPYKIAYKTVEIEKPKPKVVFERKLAIPFRVDANYDLYMALKQWQELTFTDEGEYNPLNAGRYGKIVVSAFNSAEGSLDNLANRAVKWTFDYVWFGGFDQGIQLKRGGGEPVKLTADFKFIKMTTL